MENYNQVKVILKNVLMGYMAKSNITTDIFKDHIGQLNITNELYDLSNKVLPHMDQEKYDNTHRLIILNVLYDLEEYYTNRESYEYANIINGLSLRIIWDIKNYDKEKQYR